MRLIELVAENDLHLGRVLSHIANTVAIPVALYRLDAYPAILNFSPGTIENSAFFQAYDRFQDTYKAWSDHYSARRLDLLPGGRRYEHPFVTLLRNDPYWFLWELAFFKSLKRSSTRVRHTYPDVFNGKLHFYAVWNDDLRGMLIFGPVPTPEFLKAEASSDIDSFERAVHDLHARSGRDHGKSGAFVSRTAYLSSDRLRRMLHAGGHMTNSEFESRVKRAGQAITELCSTEIDFEFGATDFETCRLQILDACASTAILRSRTKASSVFLYYPELRQFDLEFYSEKAGQTILRRNPRELPSELPDDGVIAFSSGDSSPDESLMDLAREQAAQLEDHNTQCMMLQFMLTRHWLSDRFARLSSMYDDRPNPQSENNLKALCKWLLKTFDADFSAIYHVVPGGGLKEMMCCSRDDEWSKAACKRNSEHMRTLLDTGSQRELSVCYRSFWAQAADSVNNWDGASDTDGMASRTPGREDRPKSALAVPIIVFGRSWGIIELVGRCPNQFEGATSMWLEEAGQLIGGALYQTWLLKQITQANMGVLTGTGLDRTDTEVPTHVDIDIAQLDKSVRALEVRNHICREMAELFIADGAALWLEDEIWPGLFKLKGCFNAGFDLIGLTKSGKVGRETWPEIRMADTDSSVVRALTSLSNQPNQIFAEKLKYIEIANTPRDIYQRALWQAGMRDVMIVPLVEANDLGDFKTLGALSLYSRGGSEATAAKQDEVVFGPRWVPMVEFAGRHIAMLIRTLALEAERQTSLELMFSHEVIGSLTRVHDQYGYLTRNMMKNFIHGKGDEIAWPSEVPRRDIEKAHVRVATGALDALTRLREMRQDGFKMPSANEFDFRSKLSWDGEPVVLFNAVQDAFNSRYLLLQKRKMKWKMTGSDAFIRLNMHPNDLQTIFNNLADNALKYGNDYGEIKVNVVRRDTGTLYVEFINDGHRLKSGERDRLFKLNFRGENATKSSQTGSGNGLFITKRLAQQWGVDVIYNSDAVSATRDMVQHRFSVLFREQKVVYRK